MDDVGVQSTREDARRSRANSEWTRLSSARTRTRTRTAIERARATIDESCRLLLTRETVWQMPADEPEAGRGRRHLRLVPPPADDVTA